MNNVSQRIAAWRDTLRTAPAYHGSGSRKYTWAPPDKFVMEQQDEHTKILVIDNDLVDIGKECLGYNPVVLNLADDIVPGGCVDGGSGASEEAMFRRSNYFRTLTQDMYPLEKYEAIYSPNVTVYKENYQKNYTYCEPFDLSFIACPGIKYPKLKRDGHMTDEDLQVLEKKIELILQIAYAYNHKVIVLGALGCGAWNNNPIDVAKTFKKVIKKHDGVFKVIIFAIMKRAEKDHVGKYDEGKMDNFDVFKKILLK